ncbi:MAG: AEC family transporter [Synergistaceae bacterium]|nr:AEC family transporter [Synergistaceae bacterium]
MLGLNLVLPLILIIITGNLLRRYGFYEAREIKTLTKTLYWVILPMLLFRTTFTSGREVLTQPNLFIASILAYIATLGFAWLASSRIYHKGKPNTIAVSVMSSMRGNNIYLGFPVVQLAMGETGLHYASLYIAVTIIGYHILSISAAEIAQYGKLSMDTVKKTFKKLAVNPMVISCVLGLLFALIGIDRLPLAIDEAMKLMSQAATAVALIGLGGTLDLSCFANVADMLRRTWEDCFIKLMIHPLLMLLFLNLFPVQHELMQVTVMLSAMPSAVNCFILAREMGMDGDYGADLVASTTVLGAIAIPVWAHVLGLV